MVFLLVLAACVGDGNGSLPDAVKVETMERVVQFSTTTVTNIADTYYGGRPSERLPKIVQTLIAANAPSTDMELEGMSEGEKEMMRNAWSPTFASHSPTEPWQIVVKADDARGMIILEGYGDDLSQPLISRELTGAAPRSGTRWGIDVALRILSAY